MTAAKPKIIPNSRDLVSETVRARIARSDAQQAAARAMLAAHHRNASLDVDAIRNEGRLAEVLRAVIEDARVAIAQAKAAGIK